MKFIKIETVVDAEQFFWGKHFDGVIQFLDPIKGLLCCMETNDGREYIEPGDWIVTESNGHRYIVKNRDFICKFESFKD